MKPSQDQTDTFKAHPNVVEALEAKEPWHLRVDGINLFTNGKVHRVHQDRIVYQSLTKIGDLWLRLRAVVFTGSTRIDFYAWPVYGDTGESSPKFLRQNIRITASNPVIDVDAEVGGGEILHGQGAAVKHFWVDFADGASGSDRGPALEPTPYCPKSPNQTGGLWPYMGLTFPPDIPSPQLYMLGGYGGYFQHKDTGELVTENDYPDLQADSHIHRFSKDKGWIEYTHWDAPWRDQMAVFEANQNAQHFCLFSPLAQTLQRRPADEGLRMLCEAAVHVYRRSWGGFHDRGTSHHLSGSERAQGRLIKTGADLFLALRDHNPVEAKLAGERAIQRLLIDAGAFVTRHKDTGFGFAKWGPGGYSASEIGIHYWGMHRLHQAIDVIGAAHIPEVHFWMREATRWVFDSFRYWDFPGARGWGVPYYENADHSSSNLGPTSSQHFAWLCATHHEPETPTETEKMKHILALAEGIDMRFRK